MSGKTSVRGKKLPLAVLALALILAGSFLAQLFNTSFYSVRVSRIRFDTNAGVLSGLLYMPKGAGSGDPRPGIITTHGYLNSAEMQDAGAIEMSRRGFVVLALDMYDHGHSETRFEFGKTPAFFTFWPTSLYDAAQYMYAQDYILKDAAGNGILAVAGHSMGGFSSVMALVSDEQDFSKSGVRKIRAGLAMGADYRWTSMLKVSAEAANASYGPRIVGKIAAHYDEFFFDNEAHKTGRTVVYKDYPATEEGKAFLGSPELPSEGVFYTLPNGGMRIIYTPRETHPWNHFSGTSTGRQIHFYAEAFRGYVPTSQTRAGLAPENQIWFFKELFEFIALIGFFLLFFPMVRGLLRLPVLSSAVTPVQPSLEGPKTGAGKAVFGVVMVFAALFPALFFPAMMTKTGTGFLILKYGALAAAVLSLAAGIAAAARKKMSGRTAAAGTALTVASALLLFVLTAFPKAMFPQSGFFPSPTTNQIVYWALCVTAVIALIAFAYYYLDKKPKGATPAQYGIAAGAKTILASLGVAAIAAAAGYAVLFIVDAVFRTDFRLWVWAVKTFDARHAAVALRYMPFFLVYYFAIGVTLNANTGSLKGWKGDLAACALNVGGLVLFLAGQYGKLFLTGTALYPTQALNGILLFALVPTLIVATVYIRRFFKDTGNVYVAVFLNTILMTMITLANTTVYNGL